MSNIKWWFIRNFYNLFYSEKIINIILTNEFSPGEILIEVSKSKLLYLGKNKYILVDQQLTKVEIFEIIVLLLFTIMLLTVVFTFV